MPLAPVRRNGLGAPRVRLKLSALTGIGRLKALPDQRWHSVQWQAWTNSGIAMTANRTASQVHPPVRGRVGRLSLIGMRASVKTLSRDPPGGARLGQDHVKTIDHQGDLI